VRAIGFHVSEDVGISVINPRAVRRLQKEMTSVKVFELRVSKSAVLSADYWMGRLSLYVTYRDPPGYSNTRSVRVGVGEYSAEGFSVHKEDQDALDEVTASYGEGWEAFTASLPDILLAASVLED